ncbi:MAG: hypothetical protein H6849_02555 [Alphaproteobacteria bacterium]|nr:MAG: hypothetical protein H6849_02555 [Alphaproteobacteria bacterium]
MIGRYFENGFKGLFPEEEIAGCPITKESLDALDASHRLHFGQRLSRRYESNRTRIKDRKPLRLGYLPEGTLLKVLKDYDATHRQTPPPTYATDSDISSEDGVRVDDVTFRAEGPAYAEKVPLLRKDRTGIRKRLVH